MGKVNGPGFVYADMSRPAVLRSYHCLAQPTGDFHELSPAYTFPILSDAQPTGKGDPIVLLHGIYANSHSHFSTPLAPSKCGSYSVVKITDQRSTKKHHAATPSKW